MPALTNNFLIGIIPSFILSKSSLLANIYFEYDRLFADLPTNICYNLPLQKLSSSINDFLTKLKELYLDQDRLQGKHDHRLYIYVNFLFITRSISP